MPVRTRECRECCSAQQALLSAHIGCLTHIFYDVEDDDEVEELLNDPHGHPWWSVNTYRHRSTRDDMWETLLALARNKNHREHPLFIHAVEHFCNVCEQVEDREASLELLWRMQKPHLHCEEDIMEHFVEDDNVFLLRWWNETFGLKNTLGFYLRIASCTDAEACKQYCAENLQCWCKLQVHHKKKDHYQVEAFIDTSFAKRLPQDLVKYVLKFL